MGILQVRIENIFFQKIEMLLIPGGTVVKNLPASGGEPGSVPGSGRPLQEGMATRPRVLAWEITWTEEPIGYSPWGCKEPDTTE